MIAFISTMVSDPSDREFMTSFYEKYYRLMFSVSRGICKEYYDSEEIVQDSIVKLISKISLLRSLPEENRVYYTVAVIRNTALSLLRKQAREKGKVVPMSDWFSDVISEEDNPVEDRVILTENIEEMAHCWEYLSEEEQFLLEGRYILELTDGELAEQIGCKPDSIRMKLTRTRRKMKKLILDLEEEGHDNGH